jgi:hypothetical protein
MLWPIYGGLSMSNAAEKRHMSLVGSTGCVICLEHYSVKTPCEVHHIAEGVKVPVSKRYAEELGFAE